MDVEGLLNFNAPAMTAGFCRVVGMIAVVPALSRVPMRVRGLLAIAITMGMMPGIGSQVEWPGNWLATTVALAGEVMLGIALGMSIALVFVGARWAGDLIGQQTGLGLGQVLDPVHGASASAIGDIYWLLGTVVFFTINGHHALLRSLHASFTSLPLMALSQNLDVLGLLVGLLKSSSILALQLASPVIVTMLILDFVLVIVSRGMPQQMNVLSGGMAVRSLLGMGVLLAGVAVAARVIGNGVTEFSTILDKALAGVR